MRLNFISLKIYFMSTDNLLVIDLEAFPHSRSIVVVPFVSSVDEHSKRFPRWVIQNDGD